MDEKSLELLGFPKIRQIVARFTSFSASRRLALELRPSPDCKLVSLWLKQSAEARHLQSVEPGFSIGTVSDIREMAQMAAKGKLLEPQSLVGTRNTLAAIHQARSRLAQISSELPLLWDIAAPMVELDGLVRNIDRCLAPDGTVLDRASDRLAGLRRQIAELKGKIYAGLKAIMASPQGRNAIEEPIILERQGRQVLLVKSDRRREIKGIVHDVSNTGASLYVEPLATVELGNDLREAAVEEQREVERILADLSAQVGDHEAEILLNVGLIAELDLALARARYASQAGAVEPIVTDTGDSTGASPILKLVEARHPLLGKGAVPLSVEIGRDFQILVITGPNTGGKTVALKTIGLLALMTQAGIPIPAAAETRIPVFDDIFADIGDEQSIEQTLSTFSWHMGNVIRIVKQGTGRSLVLLDELGTSTDPVEGAALAIAVLRRFLQRRIMTVATTHFAELKVFAHTTPGVQNASFDIDPVTLKHSYRLTLGIPGGSNALVVARRLGLPDDIIVEAERLVPGGIKEMESLLTDLKTREREIARLQGEIEKEKQEAARRNTELQAERKQLEADRQEAGAELRRSMSEARDRLSVDAAALHRQIREAASELRKEKSAAGLERARKSLSSVQEQAAVMLQTQKGETAAVAAPGGMAIAAGDTVRVREVGVTGTVLAVLDGRGQVELDAGGLRLRLSLDEVDKVTPVIPAAAVAPGMPAAVRMAGPAVSRELDLRGKRAGEVEPALEQYLDSASLANHPEVRIIHGFGTGVVRQMVRKKLAGHPLVKASRPGQKGEGGDGVTIVEL